MRTLLVCTDFSSQSYHAGRYALVLATQFQIPNITLFHAYRSFVVPTALPPHPDEESELLKAINFQLQQQREDIRSGGTTQTRIHVRTEKMSLAENINQLCEEENVDLVVMGVTGKTGFGRGLIGSNMIDVLRNSRCPVCVVPEQASLTPVTHILFACDINHVVKPAALARLDQTLSKLKVKLTVLNVATGSSHANDHEEESADLVLRALERHKPVYKRVEGDNVVECIFRYAGSNNVSMIVAVPANYNIFEGIIHRSITQQLTYQSMVPVLSLHE